MASMKKRAGAITMIVHWYHQRRGTAAVKPKQRAEAQRLAEEGDDDEDEA